jgi:indole-3-glycerol phosphate synthase
VLAELMAGAVEDASDRREMLTQNVLEAQALSMPPALDAMQFLAPAAKVKIIAEIKRASPSRGSLASILDPAALAQSYQSGGASAVSVLTETRKFGGTLDDLVSVRAAVGIPVLRKDFIALDYQVWEARAAGADMVLLIVAALAQAELVRLYALIASLGMTALVETHSADEVSRAIDLGANLIGVNARDLSTFELDQNLFTTLAEKIPSGIIRVAESAVKTAADVAHYRSSGADVVLVGEALVTDGDPIRTLTEFLAVDV